MAIGYLSFVLHGHLPWVLSHGYWPHGEVWLYEAASETYCPTLSLLTDFDEKKGFTDLLTLGLTPVLTEQLVDARFRTGFLKYLNERIEVSDKDTDEFTSSGNNEFAKLSRRWSQYYSSVREQFTERFEQNLVKGYKSLQDKGVIEIITSGITHGYLPLLGKEETVNAQIRGGQAVYKKRYSKNPSKGIWIPEMAYRPSYKWKNPVTGDKFDRKGIEYYFGLNDVKYSVINTPLLNDGDDIGNNLEDSDVIQKIWKRSEKRKKIKQKERLSSYQPYLIAQTSKTQRKTAMFTRDNETGAIVWSGDIGFPGDQYYLEFHKKHFPSGNKYWRVTGSQVDLGEKAVYNPEKIVERLDENSAHFTKIVKKTLLEYNNEHSKPGIIVSPYDFELFGHWWFEGVGFLDCVISQFQDDDEYSTITCSNYLSEFPPSEKIAITLPEGSWGKGNFHWNWINPETLWCWQKIYECEDSYLQAIKEFKRKDAQDGLLKRILNQMGRELFLLSSSDWEFLISTYSARDYAEMRINTHYDSFQKLFSLYTAYTDSSTTKDVAILEQLEKTDNIASGEEVYEWFDIQE
ncbi:MAG: DUF1957 domain-containing protein [Candidatus Heimdallarchaeota archaeon]|nr:DUF1957 domain-containing protein [Candidatus Heimdallarchaeota archaeon]